MNGDMHRVEVQIDEHCFCALQSQAERLGVDVEDVVQRAMSAWLNDLSEDAATANGFLEQA